MLQIPRQTIVSFINRYKNRKSLMNSKPSGRVPIINQKKRQSIMNFRNMHPGKTRRDIKRKFKINCCLATISKALHEMDFKYCRRRLKPKLAPKQVNDRIEYAALILERMWSIGREFYMLMKPHLNSIGRQYQAFLWKKRGQKSEINYIEKKRSYIKYYVKCWTSISYYGTGPLIIKNQDQRWNSTYYLELLKENLIKVGKNLIGKDFMLLSDKEKTHTNKKVIKWLKNNLIEVIDFPANSSDLNIIENGSI